METIKLDLIPGKKMPSLHASQYDDGRGYHIDLTENNEPYKLDGTEVLTVNERKGDNNICSLDIENTFADKTYVEFASTLQMCAVWGNNICELVIKRGNVTLGTLNFILEVEPSPTEGGIESESEISNLERQITEITEQVIGDDYYTADETNEAIATAVEGKADKSNTYTKSQVDSEISRLDGRIDTKANASDVNNALALKADKNNPTITGAISHYRRTGSTVGNYSVAFGFSNISSGIVSFAEGSNTIASANNAHAEGNATEASARFAHAEGRNSIASAEQSHAEGYNTTASGNNSHAEGYNTTASGNNSHAEGNNTLANHKCQHVLGEFNIPDDSAALPTARGNYVEIVGNGTGSNARSNARTLDWNGNETLAGDLTYNGNKSLTSEITRLDGRIDNLPAPMIFKGTLGVGGTIQSLPTASASNEGYTYKVITDGTYAGQTAKVGDVFTSNGSAWVLIPSGDEDTDTWRAIKVNGVEKLGNGISSGSLDVVDTDNIEAEFDYDGNKLKLKTKNIYTKTEVDNIVSDAIYNVLPDDTASGSVANFNTSLELPIKSLEIDVNAVQEEGTPTPATPLPISGWSAITLDVNGNTEVINLGGTYYGGHFTQDKDGHRQFEVTWCDLTDLGSLPWGSASNGRIGCNPTDMAVVSSGAVIGNIKSDCYAPDTQNNVYNRTNDKTIAMTNNLSTRMMLYDSDLGNKTSEEVKAALSGKNVIYELLEPYTIDLPDGEPIITFAGVNNFSADTGDSTVVFKSSVNDYVSAHSGGGLLGLGGVYLGGAKSGGGEEETDEGEDAEKVKLDDPKEEIKTIGDTKKLGGE